MITRGTSAERYLRRLPSSGMTVQQFAERLALDGMPSGESEIRRLMQKLRDAGLVDAQGARVTYAINDAGRARIAAWDAGLDPDKAPPKMRKKSHYVSRRMVILAELPGTPTKLARLGLFGARSQRSQISCVRVALARLAAKGLVRRSDAMERDEGSRLASGVWERTPEGDARIADRDVVVRAKVALMRARGAA